MTSARGFQDYLDVAGSESEVKLNSSQSFIEVVSRSELPTSEQSAQTFIETVTGNGPLVLADRTVYSEFIEVVTTASPIEQVYQSFVEVVRGDGIYIPERPVYSEFLEVISKDNPTNHVASEFLEVVTRVQLDFKVVGPENEVTYVPRGDQQSGNQAFVRVYRDGVWERVAVYVSAGSPKRWVRSV